MKIHLCSLNVQFDLAFLGRKKLFWNSYINQDNKATKNVSGRLNSIIENVFPTFQYTDSPLKQPVYKSSAITLEILSMNSKSSSQKLLLPGKHNL